MSTPSTYLWQGPDGRWRRVTVVERTWRTATIEYWDNAQRGETWKAGRRYNHGTRVRVVVYLRELKDVCEARA